MVSKYCRLSSPRSDLIIKTHPHAEIIWMQKLSGGALH